MTLGRILVVDDDKNLVDLIQMRLETAGYDVATALHEEDAIEKVRNGFGVFEDSECSYMLDTDMEANELNRNFDEDFDKLINGRE